MKHDPRYSTKRWRALRRLVLNRDGWRCMVNHPDCRYKQPGSLGQKPRIAHVHHLHPPTDGGPFWDETNLTSVCASFNIAERNQRWNEKTSRIYPTPSRPW